MKISARSWRTTCAVFLSILALSATAVVAFQVRPKASRFDALVVEDPTSSLDVATTPLASVPGNEPRRVAWEGFRAAHGPAWTIYLDRRSGAPLLAEGKGIPWAMGPNPTAESLAASLRSFMAGNKTLFQADNSELIFDREGSGRISPDVWQIAFTRAISGVPVIGERYLFTIGHGNLISFGAPRWSRIEVDPNPNLPAAEALERLGAYMRLTTADTSKVIDKGTLQIIPLRSSGTYDGPYSGPIGAGYRAALVWQVAVAVEGEIGTWTAQVDAHTGAILSFVDSNDYAQVKGGVFPVSDDGQCTDGCEQPNWPMPYADIDIGGAPQTASSLGLFNCTPTGSTALTMLAGPYVKVADTCGAVSQTATCDADVDLAASAGTDCTVPAGASVGDTHSARTSFYHLNRIAEHARFWLPSRPWLFAQLLDNVNLNQTCNAYWNGSSVNFFKSGGGCRNTGEIAGIFLHEWGHGLDANDGGGMDNPSEAYADITSLMSTHVSCIGRGFSAADANCDGYGDTCTNCSGIRDQDYAKHVSNAPATPSGFLTSNCPSGSGPCAKEVHCESYVSAETMWDLATRDLPAAGLDLASAWQLADKLWYKSRLNSGGNAYNCALPNSDGCAATSWFSKIRTADDDDGNLANGTPHAAAIFAAFNRHKIACGTAGDASNQSSTVCPAIGATTLTAAAQSGAASLSWSTVPNATSYNVLRNDQSCAAGSTIIATVPGLSYTDSGLANGFTEYYTVQAAGANLACDGLLSNCQSVTPQPLAGVVKLDAASYSCAALLHVSVTDSNVGGATTTVKLTSATDPAGETITLNQASPGSANYAGTISTTAAPAAADGLLSVVDGDTITATYIDADDGQGGTNLTRTITAGVDCVSPIISGVTSSNVSGNTARVSWVTDEAATSVVHYGLTPPPGATTALSAKIVNHAVDLSGLSECSTYFFSVESADAVGNASQDDAGGFFYSFDTVKNVQPSYPNSDGPVAIPDNNPTGATSTITVTDNAPIVDLNVTINSLTHTYDGDLVLHVIGPDGTDVILSNRRGGSGDNFVGTVFDDAASTSVSSGTAPFTGSFRPDNPLSAFNGKIAAGLWKLFVVDQAAIDVGNINSWALNFTYPTAFCGSHARYESHALVSDACSAGGGNANSYWDAGEQVQFKVTVKNDGSTPLTGVTATVSPTTPGVTMINGTASYPDIPAGALVESNAPHFTAYLSQSLACGGTIGFQIQVHSAQGTWTSSSTGQAVGQTIPGGGAVLNETFSGGIPATWTIVDGGSGGGAAATWTTSNPGGRTFASPLAAPVAIVDSDNAGTAATQDEQLITPPLDLSTTTSVTLSFDQYFRWYQFGLNEIADVEVRSSVTAGTWVNLLRQQGASSPNPDHKIINLTAQAAGATGVQVRFRYYQAQFEWWWEIDNVRIDVVSPGACNMPVCATGAPVVAKPVAEGTSYGYPMMATRADDTGSMIDLKWDVSTCSSSDHHLLFGDLANVSSVTTLSGALCDIGTTGSMSWAGVPAGDLWFVIVGDDKANTEGSWGTIHSAGVASERAGTTISGVCGITVRNNAGTCP